MALDITLQRDDAGRQLFITVTNLQAGDPTPLMVYIPYRAIKNRMRVYGGVTVRQALLAILKEHYARLNDGATLTDTVNAPPTAALPDATLIQTELD